MRERTRQFPESCLEFRNRPAAQPSFQPFLYSRVSHFGLPVPPANSFVAGFHFNFWP